MIYLYFSVYPSIFYLIDSRSGFRAGGEIDLFGFLFLISLRPY